MVRINKRKALALALLLALQQDQDNRRVQRRRRAISQQQQGDLLVAEMQLDQQRHHNLFKMSAPQMDYILSIIGPEIARQSSNFRAAIEPKQRLALTIRYLASGDSLNSLAFNYRLGYTAVSQSVQVVFSAIEKVMMEEYLPRPTRDTWTEVARGFWERWNFPNCLGAIDGRKVNIQAPSDSDSQYYDYKHHFSIVLALVDAESRFVAVQVGDYGRSSNGGVFADSVLGREMESGTLEVPPSAHLPDAPNLGPLPYVMVGDAAFPLKTYLLRPYPVQELNHDQKIFNYRLSRARRAVECAFTLLSARWRLFRKNINLPPSIVDSLILSACILHNFLHNRTENQALLNEADEEDERGHHLEQARNIGGHRPSEVAHANRNTFCVYFNSPEGGVHWQERMI